MEVWEDTTPLKPVSPEKVEPEGERRTEVPRTEPEPEEPPEPEPENGTENVGAEPEPEPEVTGKRERI